MVMLVHWYYQFGLIIHPQIGVSIYFLIFLCHVVLLSMLNILINTQTNSIKKQTTS